MGNATEKLIKALDKAIVITEGKVQETASGKKYRYDYYDNQYKSTPYWLEQLFNDAATENGKKYGTQFYYNGMSFYFDRAKFKGQKHGNISYSKLVKL